MDTTLEQTINLLNKLSEIQKYAIIKAFFDQNICPTCIPSEIVRLCEKQAVSVEWFLQDLLSEKIDFT